MVALPSAVVFDFDGIILDSETPEFESHRRIFERCGAELTREEWCDQIGLCTDGHAARWLSVLCERSPRPLDRDTFERERRRIFLELVPREPMRGIRDLLERAVCRRHPAAIASSAPARWVAPGIDRLGLTPLFGAIVTGDDVVAPKAGARCLSRGGAPSRG